MLGVFKSAIAVDRPAMPAPAMPTLRVCGERVLVVGMRWVEKARRVRGRGGKRGGGRKAGRSDMVMTN